MRTINVTGNLAADPEIKTRTDGSQYTKFRLGNHEYGDGKDGDTKWFTVFYPRTDGIVNYLKKGSGVCVLGDYNDSIYQSGTSAPNVDRTISAFKIDFIGSSKREEGQQQPVETPTPQPSATKSEPKASATKATKSAPAKPEPTVEENPDDLPF